MNVDGTLTPPPRARRTFALLLPVLLVLAGAGAWAVDAPKGPSAHPAAKHDAPTWAQLNADQKEALAPLAADWDKYDPVRKRKWLEIAVRYKDLSPEGQQRMHERMPDLARLTPEQRNTARENFKRAYALPPEKRRELTQQFQELPDEKKRELAEIAHKKPSPAPRRPGAAGASARPRSHDADAAKPGARAPETEPAPRGGIAGAHPAP